MVGRGKLVKRAKTNRKTADKCRGATMSISTIDHWPYAGSLFGGREKEKIMWKTNKKREKNQKVLPTVVKSITNQFTLHWSKIKQKPFTIMHLREASIKRHTLPWGVCQKFVGKLRGRFSEFCTCIYVDRYTFSDVCYKPDTRNISLIHKCLQRFKKSWAAFWNRYTLSLPTRFVKK